MTIGQDILRAEKAAALRRSSLDRMVSKTGSDDAGAPEKGPCGGGCRCRLPRWRALLTVVACVVAEATLGVSYTNGNLLPYLTSYMRNATELNADADYNSMMWVGNGGWLTLAVSIPLLGLVENSVPPRLYLLVGLGFNAASFFGTYWAVQASFGILVFVRGVLEGVAQAIMWPACVKLSLQWFPKRKGLVGGITMAGYGGGAFIWNQVVTRWINPENLQPDQMVGEDMYFTQDELLTNVPTCYVLLGAVLTATQILCVICISDPPSALNDLDLRPQLAEVSLRPQLAEDAESKETSPTMMGMPTTRGTGKKEVSDHLELVDVCCDSGSKLLVFNNEEDIQKVAPGDLACYDVSFSGSKLSFVEEAEGSRQRVEGLETRKEEGYGCCKAAEIERARSSVVVYLPDVDLDSWEEESVESGPLKIVQSRVIWTLWFNNLMVDYALMFIMSLYKAYGQTFIADDHLLALVGSFASLFNATSRPAWGYLSDRIGFLPAQLVAQALLVVMSGTFATCQSSGSAAMFFLWVCLMFVAFGGIFSVGCSLLSVLFGNQSFIFSLGVVCSSGLVSAMTSVPLTIAVRMALGWKGAFLAAALSIAQGTLALLSLLVNCGRFLSVPKYLKARMMAQPRHPKKIAS